MLNWLFSHYAEVLGTVFGLIYIYYSIKQNILLWVFGFVSSVFALYQCYESKIYADMFINGYYVVISVYGWFFWKYGSKNSTEDSLPIITTTLQIAGLYLAGGLLLWLGIYFGLAELTDSSIPLLDSFTTAGAIIATLMLTRKYLGNWIVFIIVDAVSVGLYYYKELYFFAFLFFVYTILAVVGYINWKKLWRNQSELF